MRKIMEIVNDLNARVWEIDQQITFALTNETVAANMSIGTEILEVDLWNSEEVIFETDEDMLNGLLGNISQAMVELETCKTVINRMIGELK